MADADGLLTEIQWCAATGAGTPCCPVCRNTASAGHAAGCRLAAAITPPLRWRHRKRGTTYREVGRALLQHSGGALSDQDVVVVYRSEANGALGVRSLIEFTDGRFERL